MDVVIVFLSLVIRLLAIEIYVRMHERNNARLIVSCDMSKLLGSSKLRVIMNKRMHNHSECAISKNEDNSCLG